MLGISRSKTPDKCVLNVLPCQANHDGPAKVIKRYWMPKSQVDGTKTVYLRGRRLRGKVVGLPEGYEGLILKDTKRTLVEPVPVCDDDEEPDLQPPVKLAEEISRFDDMIVWQHDQLPMEDDNFVKNLDEWLVLANAIHAK